MSDTIRSLSIFVGSGRCNANCAHCAGKPLRRYSPKEDGIIDSDLIRKTMKECYERGARYLSISSSGEPTLSPLSVTRALDIIDGLKEEGREYKPINLYSNGIRIGEEKNFSDYYLPLWKNLGLTTIYVTVHDINEKKNADVYGIASYPSLDLIAGRIHGSGLLMRANLVLSKRTLGSLEKFIEMVNGLKKIGVDSISAWPIRGMDDKLDLELAPSDIELDKMDKWINENQKRFVRLLREKSRELYQTGKKLTLFPNGVLSGTWCN